MSIKSCHHQHTAVHLLQQPRGKGSGFLSWFPFLVNIPIFSSSVYGHRDIFCFVYKRIFPSLWMPGHKQCLPETLHGPAQPSLLMGNLIAMGCPELFHVLLWDTTGVLSQKFRFSSDFSSQRCVSAKPKSTLNQKSLQGRWVGHFPRAAGVQGQ